MTGAEFGEVDIDLLADYIGGALAGTPDESVVAALIADDPGWRAAHESLTGGMALVGAELGRLDPEPMPAELAARLDTMFRTADLAAPDLAAPDLAAPDLADGSVGAEAIVDAAPIPGRLAEPSGPHLKLVRGDDAVVDGAPAVREEKTSRRAGRRMRWTAPIAVAAGLVAFVGFGMDYLAGRNADDSSDSSTSSAAGLADESAAAGRAEILTSGTDYTLGTLAMMPINTLAGPDLSAPAAKSPPNRSAADASAPARLPMGAALQDCLDAIERENAGGVISVESVDYARFNGAAAVVVRFAADNGVWAWASGPACGEQGGGSAKLAKVPVG